MTTLPLPQAVRSAADAELLVDWCLDAIGLGYHPDTVASDYIDALGRQCFTEHQARELDRLHDEAFDAGFGDRMYEHGLEGMRALAGLSPVGVA